MSRRDQVQDWLLAGLRAVDPEPLTKQALRGRVGPARVIAIGKAAPAMCRGAAAALGGISGLCVTKHEAPTPNGMELVIGDHPTPGRSSLTAGDRALEMAPNADLALISGGGSALCEAPIEGVDLDYLVTVNRRLSEGGADIVETNKVRSALSRVKGGGLGPLPTYVLSDVAGADPSVVASGPTIPTDTDIEQVISIMKRHGIDPDPRIVEAILRAAEERVTDRTHASVVVIGDGHTAANGVVEAAERSGLAARLEPDWLAREVETEVHEFVANARTGVTVVAGEPTVVVENEGRGGRNTHAALIAATLIAGTRLVFAALATDGIDGSSETAGAIVDGETLQRGGDPRQALAGFDSAGYLERSGNLLILGPTGTNVADLWVIWKPEEGS